MSIMRLAMAIAELLPMLKRLPRSEKLKVMQFLLAELAQEEEEPSLQPGATYWIWSPFNAHTAAYQLSALLESDLSGDA